MYILGISAFYHDSSVALIKDEVIVAAAQEERFSRKKYDDKFPEHAITFCLDVAGISLRDVDYIVFYDKPFLKFERLLETYLTEAPRGFQSFLRAVPIWLKEKLFLKETLIRSFMKISDLSKTDIFNKLMFAEHHQSHAASAFYPSPFEDAAILTIDGVGEWVTTSLAYGKDNSIEFIKEIHFPHSLGLLYSAFTFYAGFKVNSGEYKLMGLAPYGKPIYANLIKKHLIDIKEDGSYRLNMEYFSYTTGLTMTNDKFHKLFGSPPRKKEALLTQKHMDLAASIQVITEEIVVKMAQHAKKVTGSKNLCLAGGVALNCVCNGHLLRKQIFDNIWIQPAAGDAGGALGGAYSVYYQELGNQRSIDFGQRDRMQGTYLGPASNKQDIEVYLDSVKANYHYQPSEKYLVDIISDALIDEKVVGWHYGKMEFGPRSLVIAVLLVMLAAIRCNHS